MIKNEDYTKIIETCKKDGYDVRIRDIAFCVLVESIEDKNVCFQVIFGKSNEDVFENYVNSKKIIYLSDIIKNSYLSKLDIQSRIAAEPTSTLSLEENREEMIKLLSEIDEALAEKKIEYKDALKYKTDIRTKLNDKFGVNESSEDNRVVVYKKFNSICRCGREIYVPTKEDLMEKYNLVEKNG